MTALGLPASQDQFWIVWQAEKTAVGVQVRCLGRGSWEGMWFRQCKGCWNRVSKAERGGARPESTGDLMRWGWGHRVDEWIAGQDSEMRS